MGYDLYTESTKKDLSEDDKYFRWNIWGWSPILMLAARYGWEPEGTIIPRLSEEEAKKHNVSDEDRDRHNEECDDWEGDYFGNNGQLVTEEDALNMAKALEDSLDDIPDQPIPVPGQKDDGMISLTDAANTKHRNSMAAGNLPSLILNFSGKENKDYIRQFITFLRLGGYSIN